MNLLEEIKTLKDLDIEDVAKIDLEIGPVASTAATIKHPQKGVEGKFSVWFLAALALAEGNVNLSKFTDEKVNDARLVRLMRKIDTQLDPRIGFGARVCIQMKDGTKHKSFLAKPKGDPENPLSFEELTRKYRNAAGLVLSEDKVEDLIDVVKNMDSMVDIKHMVEMTLKPRTYMFR
jgi:2-methylcitrate dehydratase PrpD